MLMFVESFLVQQMAYCSDKCFSLLYDINRHSYPMSLPLLLFPSKDNTLKLRRDSYVLREDSANL